MYLDTDQLSGRDRYDRLIAVVYGGYNETHRINVNYLMWGLGHAELTDYTNNEFNPYTWTMFKTIDYYEPEISDTSSDTSDAFNELLVDYSELYYEYENLLNEYNQLAAEYNELLTDTTELERANNRLESQYNELETRLIELEEQETAFSNIPGFQTSALLLSLVFLIYRGKNHT